MSKARDIADFKFENIVDTGNEATRVAAGTNAQRPSSPAVGDIRYNSDIGKNEAYDVDGWTAIAPPPVVTSVSPTSVNESDTTQTIVITGQKFDTSASALMIDSTGTVITPTTSTRNSSSQITITYSGGDVVSNPNEPYDVKVTNGTGLSAILEDAVSYNETPDWSTASGTVATVVEDEAMTSVQLSATDPEGSSVSYSVTSGALPTGLSLSSSGLITGTPNVSDAYSTGVTHNFTVGASDGTNTTSRSFNIIRKWRDGSTSALAASSADAIKQLTGTTTSTDYWINCNGTARLIFCDMNGTYTNQSGTGDSSKGYMLLMAFGNSNSTLANGLAHTSTIYWNDPSGGSINLSGVGLTTNANYGGPESDNQKHYIGSSGIGYLAQSRSSFNDDTAGFTISRINIKGGHPYDAGGVRLYINQTQISPILSANNGTYTWEANNGSSSTWAWYMDESSSTPSISAIYHVFVR
jgi:hypothetical protein